MLEMLDVLPPYIKGGQNLIAVGESASQRLLKNTARLNGVTLMNSVSVTANLNKRNALKIAGDFVEFLQTKKLEVKLDDKIAKALDKESFGCAEASLVSSDLLVVFGGNGTLLSAARLAAPQGTPILGVDLGGFGFITEVSYTEAKEALERILRGDFQLEERMMLSASVTRGGERGRQFFGLNDVVITKGAFSRMIRLRTYVDKRYIGTYLADGLIVSTPTGSTAYSLSAGGPIVNPNINVLIITPICPHTLYARPLVISEDEKIQVVIQSKRKQEMMLTVDGQVGFELQDADLIEVSKAPFTAKLIRLGTQDFYKKLQTKLKWGTRL